jgi:nicotinamide phosphoribosyltransferase
MFKVDPLVATDAYKLGHLSQYPEGTQFIYSNFTPRSNSHFKVPANLPIKCDKVIFFGLQSVLMEMNQNWQENFFLKKFDVVADRFLEKIKPFTGDHTFSREKLKELWEYGALPIVVKALPEGSRVNIKVPVLTIANTDPRFYWITNFLETYLSAELWKMSTAATISDAYKKILNYWSDVTGGNKDFVQFQAHDFSMRGSTNMLDSCKTGAGHLLSFLGTDTLPAVDFINYYYQDKTKIHGYSVPATEHSVMCIGEESNEKETIRRIIQDVYPTGVVSIVSDSWDFWNVITNIASELKDVIISRQPDSQGLAKVVFRPDSGDPVDIICGNNIHDFGSIESIEKVKLYAEELIVNAVGSETPHGECGPEEVVEIFKSHGKYYKAHVEISWNRYDKQYYYIDGSHLVSFEEVEPEPHHLGAVECLWNIFGGTVNEKGYKTLNQKVGLIYGDSITLERANEILKRLKEKGFASDNIVFGVGSYTYTYNTRDTFGFAMKATWGLVNGKPVNISKNPKTDSGTKKSAVGLLRVENENGEFVLYDNQTLEQSEQGELRVVYDEGAIFHESFSGIKERLSNSL